MILLFERGKRGDAVSHIRGKVALVSYKSKVKPQPDTLWRCEIVEERDKYYIVNPIEEIDISKNYSYEDDGFEILRRANWSDKRLVVIVSQKDGERFRFELPMNSATAELDKKNLRWILRGSAKYGDREVEVSETINVERLWDNDYRPPLPVDEKDVRLSVEELAKRDAKEIFDKLAVGDQYVTVSARNYRKLYPDAKVVDASMTVEEDERVTKLKFSDGTVIEISEDGVSAEKVGDGLSNAQVLDLILALNTIRAAVIITSMEDFNDEMRKTVAQLLSGVSAKGDVREVFRNAIITGEAFRKKSVKDIYALADSLKGYVLTHGDRLYGEKTEMEEFYSNVFEAELGKMLGSQVKVVVWFSRYEPLPAQVEALKKIYGDDVKIIHEKRRFESTTQFLQYLKKVNASGVYAVVPLEKIKEMMSTKIGKSVDWLWAEYQELKDGVRKEEETGFEPDKDIAGYYYNLGQHRRFVGFSKIVQYELKTEPLTPLHKTEERREFMPKDQYRRAWGNAFQDMKREIEMNRVKIKVEEFSPSQSLISVSFQKDTDMFEQLRPQLKEIGFMFNPDNSSWEYFTANTEEVMKNIAQAIRGVVENIAVKVLQKHGLPDSKADYLVENSLKKVNIAEITNEKSDREMEM